MLMPVTNASRVGGVWQQNEKHTETKRAVAACGKSHIESAFDERRLDGFSLSLSIEWPTEQPVAGNNINYNNV